MSWSSDIELMLLMFWAERTQRVHVSSVHFIYVSIVCFFSFHLMYIIYCMRTDEVWGERKWTNMFLEKWDVLSAASCTEQLCGDISMFVLSLYLYVLFSVLKGAQKPAALYVSLYRQTVQQTSAHLSKKISPNCEQNTYFHDWMFLFICKDYIIIFKYLLTASRT